MRAIYSSGTIDLQMHTIPPGSLGLQIVAVRREDDLVLEVTTTTTGYDIEIVLRGQALAAANAANPATLLQQGARKLLARYDRTADTIATHPTTLTVGNPYFLEPKYKQIKTIKFEGHGNIDVGYGNLDLEDLTMPPGFVRDIFAGFGANFELRFIIHAIESSGSFDEIVLSEYTNSYATGSIAHIRYSTFDKWRRAVRRGHQRAVMFSNSAKRHYLHNAVASELNLAPSAALTIAKPADLANSVLEGLNLRGREQPVVAATNVVKSIRKSPAALKSQQTELLALNREIELLTLEQLVVRLETHMAKKHVEAFWQRFLTDNPFIIRLAFGLPIAIFGEQVAVGGVKFNGSGGKIADYLLRVGAHGNMAIIEIKTPDTLLINPSQYRGGVYAPHKEIAGAVTQVLDQRYQLQMEINNKKAASHQFDVFTYAIQGVVIAGRSIDNPDHCKSFELFRNGLKDVTVVTFGELLMKLKALHAFLMQDPSATMPGQTANTGAGSDLAAAQ